MPVSSSPAARRIGPRSPQRLPMKQLPTWLVRFVPALILTSSVVAGEVGFVEDFALSRDRAAALRQLIPGTEDYYYYHALHYLHAEQFDKADALVRPWVERYG